MTASTKEEEGPSTRAMTYIRQRLDNGKRLAVDEESLDFDGKIHINDDSDYD